MPEFILVTRGASAGKTEEDVMADRHTGHGDPEGALCAMVPILGTTAVTGRKLPGTGSKVTIHSWRQA